MNTVENITKAKPFSALSLLVNGSRWCIDDFLSGDEQNCLIDRISVGDKVSVKPAYKFAGDGSVHTERVTELELINSVTLSVKLESLGLFRVHVVRAGMLRIGDE